MGEGPKKETGFRLDVVVAASGFARKEMKEIEEVRLNAFLSFVLTKLCQYMNIIDNQTHEDLSDSGEDGESDEEEMEGEGGEGPDEVEVDAEEDNASNHRHPTEPQINLEGENSGDSGDDTREPEHQSSRPPPHSRPIPPATLEGLTTQFDRQSIKDKVALDLNRTRGKQQQKYHGRRSVRQGGRQKGSKAKQDTRVNLGSGWD